jgi:hypothetical protein
MTNDVQFRVACAASEQLMQAAVGDAHRLYRDMVDKAPQLVLDAAARPDGSMPSPADIALAERQIADLLTETLVARDHAIREAEQQHRDRLLAARAKFGAVLDPGVSGNATATHALIWLKAQVAS